MKRGSQWPRPGRWIVPAAIVALCVGSLPLWLGEEYAQPVADPAGVLLDAVWFEDASPAARGGLPGAGQAASARGISIP